MTDAETPPGLVAVPAVPWMFTRAAEAFARLAANLPEGCHIKLLRGGTTVARKRNHAVRCATSSNISDGLEWLLQIDSDMTPPPDVAERLWATLEEAGADAATATVTSANPIAMPEVYQVTRDDDPRYNRHVKPWNLDEHDGPMEVDLAGAACFMVRTEVFEELGEPWFAGNENQQSEDFSFFSRLYEKGMELVVDTDLEVAHLGVYPFGLGDAVRSHTLRSEHKELFQR